MAKYNSWDELQNSKDPMLKVVMNLTLIDKGTMYFNFEFEGKKYCVSGSHCEVSSYYWSPDDTVLTCSDFDNFWLYEVGENHSIKEEICNW